MSLYICVDRCRLTYFFFNSNYINGGPEATYRLRFSLLDTYLLIITRYRASGPVSVHRCGRKRASGPKALGPLAHLSYEHSPLNSAYALLSGLCYYNYYYS